MHPPYLQSWRKLVQCDSKRRQIVARQVSGRLIPFPQQRCIWRSEIFRLHIPVTNNIKHTLIPLPKQRSSFFPRNIFNKSKHLISQKIVKYMSKNDFKYAKIKDKLLPTTSRTPLPGGDFGQELTALWTWVYMNIGGCHVRPCSHDDHSIFCQG